MGTTGKKVIAVAFGMMLAAGVPLLAATAVHADPDCGHKCAAPCGEKCGCGHAEGKCGCGHAEGKCGCGHAEGKCGCGHAEGKCGCGHAEGKCGCPEKSGDHGAMHGKGGGEGHGKHMHGDRAAGGPAMKAGMGKHLADVREKIAKLREVEARMAGQVKDAEAFRASSLEHAKLLTDIQESHIRHMEGMMGK